MAGILQRSNIACELELPDQLLVFGEGPPRFRIAVKDPAVLTMPLTEYAIGTAYVEGRIDFDGDIRAVMDLRQEVPIGLTVGQAAQFLFQLLVRSPMEVNRDAIRKHYTLGDDFYLTFIDTRYRFYSHCIFEREHESLEEAAEHKLERMWKALGLKPGMRLLDIGGGWGGVAEYCSLRGVHVTSVTLVDDSADYIRTLINQRNLDADVAVGDFLDVELAGPFDHAVIYGVIEHIPNYGRFCARVWDVLPPGGRLYLDASATKEKFAMTPFTRKYTWPGHHTFLSLQDMLRELLFHGFEVVEVKRETRDYELTITEWARRFDAARETIIDRWGEEVYGAFRLFLWGGSHAFASNRLQAYHLVAERRADTGPRPGLGRRTAGFVGSLVD